jgi:hypothetical protein
MLPARSLNTILQSFEGSSCRELKHIFRTYQHLLMWLCTLCNYRLSVLIPIRNESPAYKIKHPRQPASRVLIFIQLRGMNKATQAFSFNHAQSLCLNQKQKRLTHYQMPGAREAILCCWGTTHCNIRNLIVFVKSPSWLFHHYPKSFPSAAKSTVKMELKRGESYFVAVINTKPSTARADIKGLKKGQNAQRRANTVVQFLG